MRYRFGLIGKMALALSFATVASCHVLVSAPAYAQTVSRIVVEGNQRVEPETVAAYMQVSPGEVATPDNIDESIKALFQTGLFSDVRISRRGGVLVVQVEENPLINRVNFEGNSELDDKVLAGEVELRERSCVHPRASAE